MNGHVFVVHGNLLTLYCDALLVPTDRGGVVEETWRREPVEPGRVFASPDRPPGARARPLHELGSGWILERHPVPWLVDVVGDGSDVLAEAIEGARAFLRAAAGPAKARLAAPERRPAGGTAAPWRALPLLALPLVGTGEAGGGAVSGDIVAALLDALEDEARTLEVDVALVCFDPVQYAAAQKVRRGRPPRWDPLDPAELQRARILGKKAKDRDLVLFLGAGVSASARLPLWKELLERLSESLPEEKRARFGELHALDQARILEKHCREKLPDAVAALVDAPLHGLQHALLAALPVQEVVTTNFDALFELASAQTRTALRTLPWERPEPGQRWLLKLHGCAKRRQDIVLTRTDYLRYADRNAALAGIVQALLITRHMLFVGFSLDDDNFHRIADAVRKAVGERAAGAYGTVLDLFDNPLKADLWAGDLDMLSMSTERDLAAAARKLEVLLDAVACHATTTANWLLDPRFSGMHEGAEERLAAACRPLLEALASDPEACETEPGRQILRFFEGLGARDGWRQPRGPDTVRPRS